MRTHIGVHHREELSPTGSSLTFTAITSAIRTFASRAVLAAGIVFPVADVKAEPPEPPCADMMEQEQHVDRHHFLRTNLPINHKRYAALSYWMNAPSTQKTLAAWRGLMKQLGDDDFLVRQRTAVRAKIMYPILKGYLSTQVSPCSDDLILALSFDDGKISSVDEKMWLSFIMDSAPQPAEHTFVPIMKGMSTLEVLTKLSVHGGTEIRTTSEMEKQLETLVLAPDKKSFTEVITAICEHTNMVPFMSLTEQHVMEFTPASNGQLILIDETKAALAVLTPPTQGNYPGLMIITDPANGIVAITQQYAGLAVYSSAFDIKHPDWPKDTWYCGGILHKDPPEQKRPETRNTVTQIMDGKQYDPIPPEPPDTTICINTEMVNARQSRYIRLDALTEVAGKTGDEIEPALSVRYSPETQEAHISFDNTGSQEMHTVLALATRRYYVVYEDGSEEPVEPTYIPFKRDSIHELNTVVRHKKREQPSYLRIDTFTESAQSMRDGASKNLRFPLP